LALLTSEQILHFQTFGFLVVKRAFSDVEMKDITTAFEQSMLDDRGGLPFGGGDRQAIFGMVERHSSLVNLVVDQRIYGTVSQLFGPGFLWTASDGNFWVGDTQWHPDRHDLTWALIKASLYLDPVNKDTGCLRVIPGSHRLPFHLNLMPLERRGKAKSTKAAKMLSNPQEGIPVTHHNTDDLSFGLVDQDVPCVALETVPGDLIFFHQNLWHASFGGRAGRRQLALSYGENPVTDDQMIQVRQMHKANLSNATERENVENDRLYGDVLMASDNPQIRAVAQRLLAIGLK
jgi:ectoine hydroxylase-related dioxygenase (phytanoyl-CoA dioxygenase family)